MYAVEFRAKVKNGTIELPRRYKGSITDTVRVIIMKEGTASNKSVPKTGRDMIETLLSSPLEIRKFHPLKRDEIYAR